MFTQTLFNSPVGDKLLVVALTLNVPADDDILNNNKKKSIFKAQNLVPRAYNILPVALTLNSPVDD